MKKSARVGATPPTSGRSLRFRVLEEHRIDTTAGLAMLDVACNALDQARAAEKILKRDGLTVGGSRGPRPHPCVSISRDARTRMLAALRALKLEM